MVIKGYAVFAMLLISNTCRGTRYTYVYEYIYQLDFHMTPYGVMLHECKLVAENLHRKLKEYHNMRLRFREFAAFGSLARLGSILEASWAVLEAS